MSMLILGVVLWMAVHLLPSLGRGLRQKMIDGMGENGYKGLFSLLLLGAIGLMVMGWRSADPVSVYIPPHAPAPGQLLRTMSARSASSIDSARYSP